MKKSNDVVLDIIKVILLVILTVVIFAAAFILTIGVGYLIGMFIAILPFVADWLTSGTPIDKQMIPTITAWLAVAGLFIGGSGAVKASKKDD